MRSGSRRRIHSYKAGVGTTWNNPPKTSALRRRRAVSPRTTGWYDVVAVKQHHSVELVIIDAKDHAAAAEFYERVLGFSRVARDDRGATVQLGNLQIVINGEDDLGLARPPADVPRVSIPVSLDRIEAAWSRDRTADETAPGPVLAPEGVFNYLTRDPAGNLVRLRAPLPDDTPSQAPPPPRLRDADDDR